MIATTPAGRVEASAVDTPIWTLTKSGRSASAVVRISPAGPELRLLVDGELLWSEVLREPGAVGRMAAEKRAEFEARGWASGHHAEPPSATRGIGSR